ncbi:efflux RND transporter periplasmic adaptor subunit [Lederbergia sp. NSJ-179]|uniref:efflux RND transporter periplasmic adaptor subunit n=1 Tax=Lederbergia sp. NSJ-179 TaxID=2931402 RepID=UPI001FD56EF6|nr:efflux RND transporter periplasmic adaptor subunit [Lederbergia sp. NSJ-179]MCJ7840620.1 efflux RND transporter periplasmic adaptor subunit [Lederbergia sp. NSJ-179]
MRKSLLLIVLVLFIGFNIFLMEKDGSKIKHVVHLSDWKTLVTGNLEKTLQTEGVVVPAEKHPVFIDLQASFKNFLVKKGEVVEIGTPLFEYESSDQEEQTALLEAEITRLEAEKKHVMTYMEELVKMKSNIHPVSSSNRADDAKDNRTADSVEAASIRELSLSIDQAIAEKELVQKNIEESIRQYETQRESIQEGIKGLTIFSPFEGKVESLSFELENPVITIISENPIVEGFLSEKQVEKVEPDMPVKLYSSQSKAAIPGKIDIIEDLPSEEASLDRDSFYRFTVKPESEDEKWRIGHHLQTEVILAEAKKVPVVAKKSVEKKEGQAFLWVLTENGIVEKRMIQQGLLVHNRQEIKSGIEIGEYYVPDPKEVSRTSPFITSFQWDKQIVHTWKKASSRKIVKYLLIGMFQK